MTGVSRSFGAIRALPGVDFELDAGEVMALLGENGAGKSTLVKILAGIVQPDSGEIRIDGELRALGTPARSLAAGIAVVQQALARAPLSAAENVFLGGGRFEARGRARGSSARRARSSSRSGSATRSAALVETLSVAERQLVEIARADRARSEDLILDEPTAALGRRDRAREGGRALARGRAARGDLRHAQADRGVRDRRPRDRAAERRRSAARAGRRAQRESLIERILGRPLETMFRRALELGEPVLGRGLETEGLVRPVDLAVRGGEDPRSSAGGSAAAPDACSPRSPAAQPVAAGTLRVGDAVLHLRPRARSIAAGIARTAPQTASATACSRSAR
jgi:ABC-type branched-subunit amino acid transport system ATPase component